MGAFNAWVRHSFLEAVDQRKTVTMAAQILIGTAKLLRFQWLVQQGVQLPPDTLWISFRHP